MSFDTVVVYSLDGDFLGYTIRKHGAKKLHTMNLWGDTDEDKADLIGQITTLREAVNINNFWPDVRDIDVQGLLDDPEFEPVPMTTQTVIDENLSNLAFGPEDPLTLVKPLLEEESDIVYKDIDVPSPVGIQARIRKACEIVAVARAEAALNG